MRLALISAVLGVAGIAHAQPDAKTAAECATAAQHFLKLRAALPADRQAGTARLAKIITSPEFTPQCAQLAPAQRTCMHMAKDVMGWMSCLKAARPAVEREPTKPGECVRPAGQDGPIIVTAAEYAARAGVAAKRFSALPEQPLQVCGIPASQARLQALTCDDGSRPFTDADAVREARKGSIGRGGPCKTMIDHYIAKCPEKTYDVHVDMYWCRPKMWPHY